MDGLDLLKTKVNFGSIGFCVGGGGGGEDKTVYFFQKQLQTVTWKFVDTGN